jgi:hypothetical protein
MFKYINNLTNPNTFSNSLYANKKRTNLQEFQQYAFNQEHKLISKNLRKYFLEKNYVIKNWDLISEEVTNCAENHQIVNDELNLMKGFTQNTDRDTMLNYLLNLPPAAYSNTFNLSKMDLCKDLIFYVEEAYNSYNQERKENRDKGRDKKRERDNSLLSLSKLSSTPLYDDRREKSSIMEESIHMMEVESMHNDNQILTPLNIISGGPSKKLNLVADSISFLKSSSFSQINENPFLQQNMKSRSQSKDSIKSIESISQIRKDEKSGNIFKNAPNTLLTNQSKSYELTVNPENLNMLFKQTSSTLNQGNITEPVNSNIPLPNINSLSESRNISYNFSNINQVSINININSLQDLVNMKSTNEGQNNMTLTGNQNIEVLR